MRDRRLGRTRTEAGEAEAVFECEWALDGIGKSQRWLCFARVDGLGRLQQRRADFVHDLDRCRARMALEMEQAQGEDSAQRRDRRDRVSEGTETDLGATRKAISRGRAGAQGVARHISYVN